MYIYFTYIFQYNYVRPLAYNYFSFYFYCWHIIKTVSRFVDIIHTRSYEKIYIYIAIGIGYLIYTNMVGYQILLYIICKIIKIFNCVSPWYFVVMFLFQRCMSEIVYLWPQFIYYIRIDQYIYREHDRE